ncbi:hypothetical protein CR513_03734, partial [Mucuna pruriens]
MRHVDTWANLKRELRSRFISTSYTRDLYNKLQCIYQGSKSVKEEYHMDMEVALTRANVRESNETTMTRFLHGLNRDIQDIVELYNYVTMDNLVHQAIRVEAQQKRRLTFRLEGDSNAPSEYSPDEEGDLLMLCSIIIGGDNSVNVASSRLVEKVKLPTLAHPRPYKLQWLNNGGELVVTKQVSLAFTLDKYEDEVLCNVVPMEATHIFLGRP